MVDADNEALAQVKAVDGLPRALNQATRTHDWRMEKKKQGQEYRNQIAETSKSTNGAWILSKMAARNAKPKLVDDVPDLDVDTGGLVYATAEEKHAYLRNNLWSDTGDEPTPELPFPYLDPT